MQTCIYNENSMNKLHQTIRRKCLRKLSHGIIILLHDNARNQRSKTNTKTKEIKEDP